MDGVLIDIAPIKRQIARELGYKISLPQTHSHLMQRIIRPDDRQKIAKIVYDDPVVGLRPQLMRGALAILREFKNRNIPFILISKRINSKIAYQLICYLGLWPKFFNANNTFFVRKVDDKNTIAQKFNVTHYIDDRSDYLDAVQCVPNRFLFDPFGQFDIKCDYTCVRSLKDFSDRVITHYHSLVY